MAPSKLLPFEAPTLAYDIRFPPPGQLLKWVGNKQRFASVIAGHLPADYGTFFEPFVGTGSVLAAMHPARAFAADTLKPLIDLWKVLQLKPDELANHYEECWTQLDRRGKEAHQEILARYNADPNPHDLLVLSRSCYAGVVRFTRRGTMSTPMGSHKLLAPSHLRERLGLWRQRIACTEFVCQSFEATMAAASEGDVVYCDPPYVHRQAILYGAQDFSLTELWRSTQAAVGRGAKVAVSIDGHRKNGGQQIHLTIPEGLFQREVLIQRGGCMLRRFQLAGETTAGEEVADRLLLSW